MQYNYFRQIIAIKNRRLSAVIYFSNLLKVGLLGIESALVLEMMNCLQCGAQI